MDATGKLPGGMVSVAICVILLMAVVIPVTQGMASTLGDRVVIENVDGGDRAVWTDDGSLTVTAGPTGTNYITVEAGGGSARFALAQIYRIWSPAFVITVQEQRGTMLDMATGQSSEIYPPFTVSAQNGTLTFHEDGEQPRAFSADWFIYQHGEGLPDATHTIGELPAYIGRDQAAFGFAVDASERVVTDAAWYQYGVAHGIGGTRLETAVSDTETQGTLDGEVVDVTVKVLESAGSLTTWIVPIDGIAYTGPGTVYLLVTIAPVVLAAALVLLLAGWMFPHAKGGRDDVFTSR